jgi:hypothetical protein
MPRPRRGLERKSPLKSLREPDVLFRQTQSPLGPTAMSLSLDANTRPFVLRAQGPITAADVRELPERLAEAAPAGVRPSLLLDTRGASAPVVLWTKSRRALLEAVLRRVGAVAIVTTEASTRNAVKLALHPFGSDLVWRVFTTPEEAQAWLAKIETHGYFLWDTTRPAPVVPEEKIARLLDAVLARPFEFPYGGTQHPVL